MAAAVVDVASNLNSCPNAGSGTSNLKPPPEHQSLIKSPQLLSRVIARSNPLFEAQFNAPRIREEMMPASLDVTFNTAAKEFFGTDYIAHNGSEYTQHLTRWIAQLNSHHVSSYASQFVQAHLTRDDAKDPKNCRNFVDMIYLSVDKVFTQGQIDEQGTHGVKFLETVLKHLRQTLRSTETIQVEERQTAEAQRKAQVLAEEMQHSQSGIDKAAQQTSRKQGREVVTFLDEVSGTTYISQPDKLQALHVPCSKWKSQIRLSENSHHCSPSRLAFPSWRFEIRTESRTPTYRIRRYEGQSTTAWWATICTKDAIGILTRKEVQHYGNPTRFALQSNSYIYLTRSCTKAARCFHLASQPCNISESTKRYLHRRSSTTPTWRTTTTERKKQIHSHRTTPSTTGAAGQAVVCTKHGALTVP
jgi:hypothetical protein